MLIFTTDCRQGSPDSHECRCARQRNIRAAALRVGIELVGLHMFRYYCFFESLGFVLPTVLMAPCRGRFDIATAISTAAMWLGVTLFTRLNSKCSPLHQSATLSPSAVCAFSWHCIQPFWNPLTIYIFVKLHRFDLKTTKNDAG